MTSVVRLTTLSQISTLDITWTDVPAAIWTPVECSVGVISACLPTMRPLFGRLFYSKDRSTGAASRSKRGPRNDSQPLYKNGLKEANSFRRLDEEEGSGERGAPDYFDTVIKAQGNVPVRTSRDSIDLNDLKHGAFSD